MTDEQVKMRAMRSTFQKEYEFFYFIILRCSESASDMDTLMDFTPVEIIDYYLSTVIRG